MTNGHIIITAGGNSFEYVRRIIIIVIIIVIIVIIITVVVIITFLYHHRSIGKTSSSAHLYVSHHHCDLRGICIVLNNHDSAMCGLTGDDQEGQKCYTMSQ